MCYIIPLFRDMSPGAPAIVRFVYTHNIWWSDQEPSICTLLRLQTSKTRPWKIEGNHNILKLFAQKLYDENI